MMGVNFDRRSAERIARTVREHETTPAGPNRSRADLPPNITGIAQFQLLDFLPSATDSLTGAASALATRLFPDPTATGTYDDSVVPNLYTPQNLSAGDSGETIYVVSRSRQATAPAGTYGIAIFADNEWLVVWLDCS